MKEKGEDWLWWSAGCCTGHSTRVRKRRSHAGRARKGFNGWELNLAKSVCMPTVIYIHIYIDLHESASELTSMEAQILSWIIMKCNSINFSCSLTYLHLALMAVNSLVLQEQTCLLCCLWKTILVLDVSSVSPTAKQWDLQANAVFPEMHICSEYVWKAHTAHYKTFSSTNPSYVINTCLSSRFCIIQGDSKRYS